nr:hypothetical protein CFP56_63487 [Quercus suber]
MIIVGTARVTLRSQRGQLRRARNWKSKDHVQQQGSLVVEWYVGQIEVSSIEERLSDSPMVNETGTVSQSDDEHCSARNVFWCSQRLMQIRSWKITDDQHKETVKPRLPAMILGGAISVARITFVLVTVMGCRIIALRIDMIIAWDKNKITLHASPVRSYDKNSDQCEEQALYAHSDRHLDYGL